MTELGPLPDTWESVRLDVVAQVKYGKANPGESGSIPVVGSGGVFSHTKTALVDHPTIVVGRKGTAGRVWFSRSPCYPSDTTFYLQWKRDIDATFLFHFMGANPLSGAHAKTTLPSLQKHCLESMVIPLPPLSEQKAIAGVLSAIQQATEAQDKVIAAARELKKSLMKHLFTYGPVPVAEAEKVSLRETEVGPVPQHWAVVRLEEVVQKKDGVKRGPWGGSIKKDIFVPAGYKVYEQRNVIANDFCIGSYFIDDGKYKDLEDFDVRGGDILVTAAGTLGKIAVVPENTDKGIINQALLRLRVNEDIIDRSYFRNAFIRLVEHRVLEGMSHGATLKNLSSVAVLKSIPIPLPPKAEQQEITHMLASIDAKIEAETMRKASLQTLFTTMLHNLMTGNVRVKDMEGIKA